MMALRATSLCMVLGCAAQDIAREIMRDIDLDNEQSDVVKHFESRPFSASYVEKALSEGVDWTLDHRGVVTSVKNQGGHPWCGTYARIAAAEGQYAMHSGHPAVNLSVYQIKDCHLNQVEAVAGHNNGLAPGLMSDEAYNHAKAKWNRQHNRHNTTRPCLFDASKVVPDYGKDIVGVVTPYYEGHDEDQAAAFIHHNGPVSCGVHVQSLGPFRKNLFVTAEDCKGSKNSITHSVLCVGFGTDPVNGSYWKIKNQYGPGWGDHGFLRVARGVGCAGLGKSFGPIPVYKHIGHYRERSEEVLV